MTATLLAQLRRLARVASPGQWLARGTVVVAALGTVLAGGLAGGRIHWLLVVLVLVSAIVTALQPDSHAGGVTLFLLVMFWWWTVPSTDGPMVLVAATCLVALHVAATLAAYGPSTLVIEPELVGLWMRRAGLLWGAAFAAWAAGRIASPGGVSLVLALLVVTGVAWWAAVRFGPAAVPGER
jgi:hypothetical protein